MWKRVSTAIGGVTLVLGLVFGIWKIEDRYATAGDVAKEVYQLQQSDTEQKKKVESVEVRLDIKVFSDYRNELQGRIWKLDDRYGIGCAECEPTVLEIYTKIALDMKGLDEKLKSLKGEPK